MTVVFALLGLALLMVGLSHAIVLVKTQSESVSSLLVAILMSAGLVLGTTQWLVGRTWWVAALAGVSALILILRANYAYRSGHGHRHGQSLRPVGLMFTLWVFLFFINAFQNAEFAGLSVFERLLPGLFFVCLLVSWRRASPTLAAYTVGGSFAVGIALMLTPFASSAWRACDQFKCGVLGEMLTGPFSSENYLAFQAIIVGALALTQYSGVRRVLTVAVVAAVLLGTESRTSQLAMACGFAAWFFARQRRPGARDRLGVHRDLNLLARSVPFAVTILAFLLIANAGATSFSNRGNTWMRGWASIAESPFVGLGLQRWDLYQALRIVPDHYPHSQYLLIAFSGGVVAVVIFIWWLTSAIRSSPSDKHAWRERFPVAVVFMVAGLAEIVWNPLAMDGLVWTALAVSAPTRSLGAANSAFGGNARSSVRAATRTRMRASEKGAAYE